MQMQDFIMSLGSKAPTPGGGGASALLGSVSSALCSMVANLTSGKPKYAAVQDKIENAVREANTLSQTFLHLITEDEAAFLPLANAYSLPKDSPERASVLEAALEKAVAVPLEILQNCVRTAALCAELAEIGSRLAVSDAGVAAAACEAAAKGAALNIYINTQMMKNRVMAKSINAKTAALIEETTPICRNTYEKVQNALL